MSEWSKTLQMDFSNAVDVLCLVLPLTRRQAEVLHWTAEAKTNEEIGIILSCSVNTVKTHIRDIFQRLNVNRRIAAAACAYRAHVIHTRNQRPSPDRAISSKNRSR